MVPPLTSRSPEPSEPVNLLVKLYRLAHRQQENFTTESLAYVLQHLIDREPLVAVRVLEWLTGLPVSRRTADASLRVRTQLRTDECGIPDLHIEAVDLDAIVEVKLDGGLAYDQAAAYERELEARGRTHRAFVGLTGATPKRPLPQRMRLRTWGELGLELSEAAMQSTSELTRHLVDQLVGLLNHLDLMPLRVRSPLSKAMSEHRRWANENPSAPALTRAPPVKSFRRLREMERCEPVRNLLLQMKAALADSSDARARDHKLDSGPYGAPPWIGFNIERMKYFFYLSLNAPEKVTLQRYRDGVDPASFDGSLGELHLGSNRKTCWRVSLDLADPEVGYLEADEIRQLRILSAFFEPAFEFAQRLRPDTGSTKLDSEPNVNDESKSLEFQERRQMAAPQWTCFEPDQPSGWTNTDLERFVETHTWIFARTMPQNPHEYALRRDTDDATFEAAVRFIREHGEREVYRGMPYKTLYFGDHKFWTMGAPLAETVLINRKLLPNAGGPEL